MTTTNRQSQSRASLYLTLFGYVVLIIVYSALLGVYSRRTTQEHPYVGEWKACTSLGLLCLLWVVNLVLECVSVPLVYSGCCNGWIAKLVLEGTLSSLQYSWFIACNYYLYTNNFSRRLDAPDIWRLAFVMVALHFYTRILMTAVMLIGLLICLIIALCPQIFRVVRSIIVCISLPPTHSFCGSASGWRRSVIFDIPRIQPFKNFETDGASLFSVRVGTSCVTVMAFTLLFEYVE